MKTKILAVLLNSFFFPIIVLHAQVKGVQNKNGKWGLADGSGKMITAAKYYHVGNNGNFSEGLASVWLNKKCGYIDTTGKTIIPIKFDDCEAFKSGAAIVYVREKQGLIDKKGQFLIPAQYESFSFLNRNLLFTSCLSLKKNGVISKSGKLLLPCIYDQIRPLKNGYGIISLNNKKGFYNEDGKIVIPCKYDEVNNFEDGLSAVAVNKKWGYIDLSGKVVIPLEYESEGRFTNGIINLRKNGAYEKISKPKMTIPASARELLAYYINASGGQANLDAIKNYQFTVEEYNAKMKLYTTTNVYHSGNNIHAAIYDNNSGLSTTRIMTGGEMWLRDKDKLTKEAYESDNVFIYSLPTLLLNAEKIGYKLGYNPTQCEASGEVKLVVTGKGLVKTDYVFSFTNDFSIIAIEVITGDNSYTFSNLEFAYMEGVRVLSGWSSSLLGKDDLVWTKRKNFQANVKMNDAIFLKTAATN